MTLTPAYGRDYKTKAEALAAFDADKDWIINDITSRWDGKPVNKSQLSDVKSVQLRYNKMRDVCIAHP